MVRGSFAAREAATNPRKKTASARSGLNAGSPLPSHAQLPAIPRRIDAQRPNQGPHQTCFGRRKPVFAMREPCGHTVAPGTALSDVPALSPPSNLVLAAHQNRGFRTAIPSVWRTVHTACQNRKKTSGLARLTKTPRLPSPGNPGRSRPTGRSLRSGIRSFYDGWPAEAPPADGGRRMPRLGSARLGGDFIDCWRRASLIGTPSIAMFRVLGCRLTALVSAILRKEFLP
jgi:hypothetical protein